MFVEPLHADPPGIRRMTAVAAHGYGGALAINADLQTSTERTVAADRIVPVHDVLEGIVGKRLTPGQQIDRSPAEDGRVVRTALHRVHLSDSVCPH